MGVLTVADVEAVLQSGETKWTAYPQAKQFDKWLTQLLRLEQEFGLTPSARSRIVIESQKTVDPLAEWRSRKPG